MEAMYAAGLADELQQAIQTEVEAKGLDESGARWLACLIDEDPALPVPTAGAMVGRVRELSIGSDLAALDEALERLSAKYSPEMTTSERRVLATLLNRVVNVASTLRSQVSS
ncbi:MAG: hypothetical protein E3J64_09955 [Anaerolineales bacterium]|nr:MAG: hypothetical protein E3J64_09955 [Anaerolineales bacterium]